MKLNHTIAFVVAALLSATCSWKTFAADSEVEGLKTQLKALEAKVAELEKDKEKAAPAVTGGEVSREALNDQEGAAPRPDDGAAAGAAAPDAEEAPAAIPPGRASPVTPRQAFNDEQEAVPRPDDLTLDPKYLGYIPVPGTPVIIKFNAKPRVDFTWDPQDTGDNSRFITAKIPVDGDPDEGGGSVFNINAKGSRLSLDVRAPQVAGAPRFYFENDFFGSGSSEFNFRVRHIYGQICNVIVILLSCVVAFLFRHRLGRLNHTIAVLEALGLGAYAVVGVEKSLAAGLGVAAAVIVGAINAVGGGLLRDILVREEPLLFKPGQFCALAALSGCGLFALLRLEFDVSVIAAAYITIGVTFLLRILAIRFNWKTEALRGLRPPARQAN